jgi:hypothetical protein
MSEPKRLTRRQRAVIEDLFAGEMTEPEVLAKHNVSTALYDRWLTDARFCECFERRVARAYREARLTLARHAPEAAKTLIDLTTCEKEETARRACLDIVAPPSAPGAAETPHEAAERDPIAELPPETATRLLAALADSAR